MSGHHRQKRFGVGAVVEPKTAGPSPPPPTRRLLPIQVVRRETIRVVAASIRSLQRIHPDRHQKAPLSMRPQVCNRLWIEARRGSAVVYIRYRSSGSSSVEVEVVELVLDPVCDGLREFDRALVDGSKAYAWAAYRVRPRRRSDVHGQARTDKPFS